MLISKLKPLFWIVLGLAVAVAGGLLMSRQPVRPPNPQGGRLTVEQIQGLSNLVNARVQVADVILIDQHGLTGGVQVAAVIRGDYLLATDLAQARFEQMDPAHRRALLVLAPPTASSPRVDLEHSRLFGLGQYGLWQLVPGETAYTSVVNKTYQQAQASIAAASADPLAIQQARRQAETVLVSFLRAVGWEVTVRWLDEPATRPASSSLLPERNLTVSDKQQQQEAEPEQPQAELRSRLVERIGYLAARYWLRAIARETGTTSNSEDAQRTVSYNGRRADAADADSD